MTPTPPALVPQFHTQQLPCLVSPHFTYISLNQPLSTLSFKQQAATILIMPDRRTKPTPKSTPKPFKPWSMYPSHHNAVSHLLEEHALSFDFHEDDDNTCEKEYDTNIMGWFTCHNCGCLTRGWLSKMIAITICMYPGAEYNVRVYH